MLIFCSDGLPIEMIKSKFPPKARERTCPSARSLIGPAGQTELRGVDMRHP